MDCGVSLPSGRLQILSVSPKGLLGRGRGQEALRIQQVLVSGLLSGLGAEWILTGIGKDRPVLDWLMVVSVKGNRPG